MLLFQKSVLNRYPKEQDEIKVHNAFQTFKSFFQKTAKLTIMGLMQYFSEQKQKAQSLKAEIVKTDREIDRMVFELYGLSEEEIKIVEGKN